MSDSVMTKRYLLNILEQVDDDAEIHVMVNVNHLSQIKSEDGSSISVNKLSVVNLNSGAGIGGENNRVVLVSNKLVSQ